MMYILIMMGSCIAISVDNFDFTTNVTAVISCFNNIGPAYGEAVGGFFVYSQFSKVVLSIAMLLGRLEIFPLLILCNPSTWKKQ